MIDNSLLDQIQARTDIVALIGDYVQLESRGGSFWGCCPFHQEKTASFKVDVDKKFFYCFGCQAGGSVFKFIMDIEKISFSDAATKLANQVGLEIHKMNSAEKKAQQEQHTLAELYTRLTHTFEHCLWQEEMGTSAQEYLKERGIEAAVARHYRLGYAPAGRKLKSLLLHKGYSEEFLKKSGLFSKNYPDFALFSERLVFPITRKDGQVIAFSARALSSQSPKYINSPDTLIYEKKRSLFGLEQAWDSIKKENHVFFCEGNFDVLSMQAAGFANTLAPLGTALTEQQIQLLQRSIKGATLVFDADAAGERALFKAVALLEKLNVIPKVVSLETGEDPAQLFHERGAHALREKMLKAVDFCEFFIQFIEARYNLRRLVSLQEVIQLLKPIIQASNSAVRRSSYLLRLAKSSGMSEETLERDLKSSYNGGLRSELVSQENSDDLQELELLALLASNFELFDTFFKELNEIGLHNKNSFFLYKLISERGEQSWEQVFCRIESCEPELAKRVLYWQQKTMNAEIAEEVQKRLVTCQYRFLKRCRQVNYSRLSELEKEGVSAQREMFMEELLREQDRLNRKLRNLHPQELESLFEKS